MVQSTGLFTDRDHLNDHVWEHASLGQRLPHVPALADALTDVKDRLFDDQIARGPGANLQGVQDWDAGLQERPQRPREARHGDLA